VTRVRQALGAAGLLLAGIGVVTNHPLLVWGAIALLATSVTLRLVAAFCNRRPPSGADSLSRDEDA
jgi:hypothetical protein